MRLTGFGLMIVFCVLMQGLGACRVAAEVSVNISDIKTRILDLAHSFEGQGDPDRSRQNQMDVLVKELVAAQPQAPVAQRLPLIAGAWRQVWGPYDYRNDDRGVDPEIKVDEIYQYVSLDGFYYNVNPSNTQTRIGLLKGTYRLDPSLPNVLRVKFTRFIGTRRRPDLIPLWELPELAESGRLPEPITIVPSWIVWLFFGRGALEEVYTDRDLRITYGSDGRNWTKNAVYILERVVP